ncbi:hypothetical protein [Haladaptatus sp. YSMS36]|uniref:hypothetical protein n=1 Tax=Haladaptatus sp. YSMS36 TaxID=3033384 RepID=UPI0023E7FCD4|nr:hypothetical protein [Haladaptatus sp. YSMS36]
MNSNRVRTILIAALAVTATFAGVVTAEPSAVVEADPTASGADANHKVFVVVDEQTQGRFTNLTVDYGDSGVDVSSIEKTDITRMSIDRRSSIDGIRTSEQLTYSVEGVSPSAEGTAVTIQMTGQNQLSAGDEVVLVLGGVTNPEKGCATATKFGSIKYRTV